MNYRNIPHLKKALLLIFNLLLIRANSVYAAPSPWGIAINPQTKECAGYWAGDEFVNYELPNGWEAYYEEQYYTVNSPFGSCYGKDDTTYSECCQQMGLTAVDYKNIPMHKEELYHYYYNSSKIESGPYKCEEFVFDNLNEHRGVSINKNTKECTAMLTYELLQGTVSTMDYRNECLADKNWINYETTYEEKDYRMITPYGECDFGISGEEGCCQQLGYTYVTNNIGQKRTRADQTVTSVINLTKPESSRRVLILVSVIVLIAAAVVTLVILKSKRNKRNKLG